MKNTGVYGPDRGTEVSVGTKTVQRWREGSNGIDHGFESLN